MWYLEVWLIVLTLALVFSMLVGFIGWVRYRDSENRYKELEKLKLEEERTIGNFFRSIQ